VTPEAQRAVRDAESLEAVASMNPAVGGREHSALSVFAEELRHARTARGLSQDQLGEQVNFSGSQIGMVEARRRVPSLDLARRCDEALETTGTLERLHELLHMTPFAPWFRPYVELENEATELRSWQSLVVDGLLQTPDYARALLSVHVGTSEDEVEQQAAARLQRQEVLNRPRPPLLWVVMDEAVLRRPVGGPAVMLAQIEHLAEMAERPNVVIQLVPVAAGAHDGVNGSFVIADFADAAGIVYLETALRGMILDRAEQVAAMRVSYDGIRTEALPRAASANLMREVAKIWT
jgi:transcriptional regulator with XRE-family HTH domain